MEPTNSTAILELVLFTNSILIELKVKVFKVKIYDVNCVIVLSCFRPCNHDQKTNKQTNEKSFNLNLDYTRPMKQGHEPLKGWHVV